MNSFARLFLILDQSTKINFRIDALIHYFSEASDADKLWALALFTNKRPKRLVTAGKLKDWVKEKYDIQHWLFEESQSAVGELTETITLVVPEHDNYDHQGLSFWVNQIITASHLNDLLLKEFVLDVWEKLNKNERYVFNKLITGGFRTELSLKILSQALTSVLRQDEKTIAYKLIRDWHPETHTFSQVFTIDEKRDALSKPYPFYLPFTLESNPENLGSEQEWFAERKWDGIRIQLIHRKGNLSIWTWEMELITNRLLEFISLNTLGITDYVLDGSLMCLKDDVFLPYNELLSRINNKKPTKKVISSFPLVMIAYDILEYKGEDLRTLPMYERLPLLEGIVVDLSDAGILLLSPLIPFEKWNDLEPLRNHSKELQSSGIILKKRDSVYMEGQKRGEWWKWNADLLSATVVLMYAQRAQDWRRGHYSEYTFGLPNEEGILVPVVKSYQGLKEDDYKAINSWIRENIQERFGPVIVVKPELVFEISFKGVLKSNRHKSGVVLRSPKLVAWLKEKSYPEVSLLSDLKSFI